MSPSGIFVAAFSSLWILILANTAISTSNIVSYPLVPHHVQRMRRRHLMTREYYTGSRPTTVDLAANRRRASAQQVGALYQGYGTHYVDLWCGSPPQRQTVIVDTGSGLTAFPCSGCNDCGVPTYHIDALFDEQASSTFHQKTCENGCFYSRSRCSEQQCSISIKYAERSRWDANEAVDSCYIGGPHEVAVQDDGATGDLDPRHVHAFDLVFGCQTFVSGHFKTQLADGIMGMNSRTESFWSQMFAAGQLGSERQFSLCFSSAPTADRKGTEAGAVTLGGVDERFDKSPMVYTPDSNGGREGFFSVRVRRVYLRDGSAGESAKSSLASPHQGIKALEVPENILNAGGIIVDSGTTDTYWNRGIASAFNEAFLEMTGRRHNNDEISLTHDELMALPTVLFQLVSSPEANAGMDANRTAGLAGSLDTTHPFDVLLAFPPSHYMEFDDETEMYTSRFYPTKKSSGSVLGANAMMGHNILFDSDHHRIGWAESDCDYTKLVTASGYDFSITGNLQSPPAPSTTPVSPPIVHPTETPQIAATLKPSVEPATEPPVESPTEPPTDPPVPHPTLEPTDPQFEPPAPTQFPVVAVGDPPVAAGDPPVALSTLPPTDPPIELTAPLEIPGSPSTDPPVELLALRTTDPPDEPMVPMQTPVVSPTHSPLVLQTETSSDSPVIVPTTLAMQTDEMKQNALKFVEGCTSMQCWASVFASLILLMCMSCCLCFRASFPVCFFCRLFCPRNDYSYSTAATNGLGLTKFRDNPTVAGYDDAVEYENEDDESSGKYGGYINPLTVSKQDGGKTSRGPWGNLHRRYCGKIGVPNDGSLAISDIEKSSFSFAKPFFSWFPKKVARQKA